MTFVQGDARHRLIQGKLLQNFLFDLRDRVARQTSDVDQDQIISTLTIDVNDQLDRMKEKRLIVENRLIVQRVVRRDRFNRIDRARVNLLFQLVIKLKNERRDLIAEESIVSSEKTNLQIDPIVRRLYEVLQMVPLHQQEIVQQFLVVRLKEIFHQRRTKRFGTVDQTLKLLEEFFLEDQFGNVVGRRLIVEIVIVTVLQITDVGS